MPTHVMENDFSDERGTLLAFLEAQRGGVRRALIGLSDEQAAQRPSASGLSLSGLLKHVAEVELTWLENAQEAQNSIKRDESTWHLSFQLEGAETVESMLAFWDEVAAGTEAYVRSVPDLDVTFPLPAAPWFPPNTRHSVRWLLLHLIEETARHAGHADIVRESLDGKTAFELVAAEAQAGADGEGGGAAG